MNLNRYTIFLKIKFTVCFYVWRYARLSFPTPFKNKSFSILLNSLRFNLEKSRQAVYRISSIYDFCDRRLLKSSSEKRKEYFFRRTAIWPHLYFLFCMPKVYHNTTKKPARTRNQKHKTKG